MQKGKHQGGQTQGYNPRNYSAYPGNPDNTRQFTRDVSAFHASGTPGGGPGMRGMHHAPPPTPPTPPTSQDIKQPPAHLPPQAHPMPPQSGGQMMQFALPGAGRGNPLYSPPRAPPGNQRMPHHARPPVVMSNSAQSFISQPVVQYQGPVLSTQMSGQAPMFVGPPLNQPFQLQQPRHQGGAYYPQQIIVPQHTVFPYSQQPMYYQSVQPIPRAGGPAPTSQGGAPAQQQPPLTLLTGHGGAMMSNPGVSQVKQSRPKKVLEIIDPSNGRNIFDDMIENDNTSSRSGESSARQTPQPSIKITNPITGEDVLELFKKDKELEFEQEVETGTMPPNAGQKSDPGVAAEFATRVAIAARDDPQSSSRTSNYSESESQASPDPQGMSTPSVSPSKLDSSVESISSENPIGENNLSYDANQPRQVIRTTSWTPAKPEYMPVDMLTNYTGMISQEDIMRGAHIPIQTGREYSGMQHSYFVDANTVPIVISKDSAPQMESPVRSGPERKTPVVSALVPGPMVDINPRREPFPALIKSGPQQSPVKRKQRSEQAQDQGDSGKVKDQQFKPKSVTPNVDSKKQPTQPSQDSDEFVQSVQAKTNEPKTIIKKNDSDSGTKTKSNESIKNKESNNVETRNLNEEIVQDNNNSRNKSENVKSEVSVSKESSPVLPLDESVKKNAAEESRENAPPAVVPKPEPEVVSTPTEDVPSLKPNGETAEEDAKSNNQKSKPGNKRPAQSKMRLESKDSRNAEPETPAIEVTPSAPPVPENKNSTPANTVSTNEQLEKEQEEPSLNEDKEKEKEDLIVAAKNEENNKQSTSIKANDATHTPSIPNKVVLKHTYEADQWSPLNPEGKKKYDRDFIMSLQNEPHSKKKPTNLPSLELLNDNNKQRPFDRNVINSVNRMDVMYPSFANKNSSQRGGQAITKRGSQGKPKAAKPAVVQVTLQTDIKLHETENAWKPARITESANRTEEEAETDSLYKRVRGILNKLTPEKFDTLVAQVKELPINNPQRLKGVIDLVFKKAVDEPSFSVAYAKMCKILQKMEVPSDDVKPNGKSKPENFRNLLLGRCQEEFEKNTADELKRDERLKEIEQEKDPDKRKLLQVNFEEVERRIRMRSVGNIRFIGELYKMHMLTCNIMHNCVNHLLSQSDEESLECLCKLLTTIGQGLESEEKASDKSGKNLNSYFKKLDDIVKTKGSGKVSSRVRFMIQDLIDLRNSDWVPRRNESQPKTMEQIQKEAERETMEMNLALNSPQERNKRQDMRNSMENRKRGGPDSAGWMTVGCSQTKKSGYVIDYAKLKIDQSDVETATLGNRTQFIWGQGASSGKSDDKRSMSQLGANKYALLSTPSSGSSSWKGMEKDRVNSYKALDDELKSSKGGSQQDSRSSSRESASSKREEGRYVSPAIKSHLLPPQPSVPREDRPMSIEDVRKNVKRLLDEYLNLLDLNEAAADLDELFTKSSLKDFVKETYLVAMEKRGLNNKRTLGKLMNYFIIEQKISREQFFVGLSEVLEAADDLSIDMPFVWNYLAEILVDMCAEDVVTFKDLASAMAPIQGSPGCGKFLAALFQMLVATKDVKWLKERWIRSQVKLSDFINEEVVDDFVKQNNVEYMSGKCIKTELSRLINAEASFDDITAWITANVGEKSKEPSFLRTLMTVLLEASVTKGQSSSYKFDKDFFSNYDKLIVRYTNHMEKLELPCLYAVQAFVHKLEFPPSVLLNIFEHLCDDGLISLEAFKSWRTSVDPHEQEGHAVCVTSLTSFFTLLNEPDTDEEEPLDNTQTNSELLEPFVVSDFCERTTSSELLTDAILKRAATEFEPGRVERRNNSGIGNKAVELLTNAEESFSRRRPKTREESTEVL